MERIYRFAPVDGGGLEHLSLQWRDDVIVAESVVVGDRGGHYGCSYRICCDSDWHVRSVEVVVAGGGSCVLTSDGQGEWRDGDGRILPLLAGCIDVDISATPFTNTLPIRRLGARLAERTGITVAYIKVPELGPRPMDQAYTRLADGRYLYESVGSGFQAALSVDADGVALDYPGLFRRITPA
jgi:hypothetical protein